LTILDIEGLALTLGERPILNGINLAMEPGEFRLVIGPNGAGKSSMLKCVLGLHRHSAGRIHLDGRPVREMTARERARLVAYVPQFLDLQFNLDVMSFMRLSRYAYDRESLVARDQMVAACLERTGTLAFQHAYLDELSGGERQRVMVAAALAQQPRLLILDEPGTSLDPAHRRDLVHLLADLNGREGLAILLVTHQWNEYIQSAPRILALKAGCVVFEGPAETIGDQLTELFDIEFHQVRMDGRMVNIPKMT
jgi:iron complex transport system ATP-binding protein